MSGGGGGRRDPVGGVRGGHKGGGGVGAEPPPLVAHARVPTLLLGRPTSGCLVLLPAQARLTL